MIYLILFFAVGFLAYSNGANDNFKGVATLFGTGTANFKNALSWATFATLLGSLFSLFLAGTLVKNFSGKGLVPAELLQTPEFAVSIAMGAAFTVFLATNIGMPVSTTHGLVGGLFGSGVLSVGLDFNFSKLAFVFLVPLIVSPLISAVASAVLYLVTKNLNAFKISGSSCICMSAELDKKELFPALANIEASSMSQSQSHLIPSVKIDSVENCQYDYRRKIWGINIEQLMVKGHYLSAGVVSFSRGLNDTPKIMGLLLILSSLDIKFGMIFIALIMALGGVINSKNVALTISKKITPMSEGQGLLSNMTTGLLVTTASLHGLPVSTTHVSVGSIFGIGCVTGKADIKIISKIISSWILTLPTSAVASGIIYYFIK